MKSIKEFVSKRKEMLKDFILDTFNYAPTLAIVQVGNNEASNRYIRNKIKDCREVKIDANLYDFKESVTEEELIAAVANMKEDGVIVQLPLPSHISADNLAAAIPREKDVDGFKKGSPHKPCTPSGIMKYLEEIDFKIDGCFAVVIGRSKIVGRPMAQMLDKAGATVVVAHSRTKRETLRHILKEADLVICAVGKENIIDSDMAPKAFIVDVGINFNEDGKLVGDVFVFPEDRERVTPVPGGVGLLTRLALLENVAVAAQMQLPSAFELAFELDDEWEEWAAINGLENPWKKYHAAFPKGKDSFVEIGGKKVKSKEYNMGTTFEQEARSAILDEKTIINWRRQEMIWKALRLDKENRATKKDIDNWLQTYSELVQLNLDDILAATAIDSYPLKQEEWEEYRKENGILLPEEERAKRLASESNLKLREYRFGIDENINYYKDYFDKQKIWVAKKLLSEEMFDRKIIEIWLNMKGLETGVLDD